MNTLTYLSRQFDVAASPRSPPDIDQSYSMKRVKTWSTKSFLFPPPPPSPTPPKRSLSSPSDFLTFVSVRQPLKPSSSPSQSAIPSKSTLGGVIRRLFFVRLFVLVCRLLSAAWSSVAGGGIARTRREPSVESGTDTDSKDSDHAIQHISLNSPGVMGQPPISPIESPSMLYFSRIHTSHPDHASIVTIKQEPDLQPPISLPTVAITIPETPSPFASSRTSTPVPARKTSFHLLPKTLVLDLDETLIHSTSRPMPSYTSSHSGLLGLGAFGRRNKGAGHMVEVVLGGRSTLYHVYKRPFVDFFLRTVRNNNILSLSQLVLELITFKGLWLVYTRDIHCIHAGIR